MKEREVLSVLLGDKETEMSKTMTKTKPAKMATKRKDAANTKAASSTTKASKADAPTMDIRTVPLAWLTLDPGNVRKSRVSDHATAELAASIATIGLITPLGCFEISKGNNDKKGTYSVIAGGRRLTALLQLAKDDKLPTSLEDGIPVVVFSGKSEMTEISLAENVVRADMTAVDQIEAWGKLHADGMAAQTIAARFGVAEGLVAQRLKLSSVAQPILDALRAEEIDLGTVRAFTVADDQDAQITLFDELSANGNLHESAVRDALTEDKASLKNRLAKFVGLDSYKRAGGTVTHDLFADDDDAIILNNPDILAELVDAKTKAITAEIEAEGWKWVEMADDAHPSIWDMRHLTKDGAIATEAEAARLAEIRETMWQVDDREALLRERREIEAAIDTRGAWSEDQLAIAGVVVSISYDGQIKIERGLVRKADDPMIAKAATQRPAIPAKVVADLGIVRTQIVQAHMLVDPELAMDIIAYNFAQEILCHYERVGSISRGDTTLHPGVIDGPFGKELVDFRQALDASWAKKKTPATRLKAFRALPAAAKQAWIVYAVATSISIPLDAAQNAGDQHQLVAASLPIDWVAAWRPDVGFWNRITKQGIAELVEPVLGTEWMKEALSLKKAALAERLGDIFTGKAKSLTSEQTKVVNEWQVPGMKPHG